MTNESDSNKAMSLKLDTRVALPAGTAVTILQSLSEQVGALHASGQVHRAITATAIEQDSQGNVRLSPVSSVCWLGRVPVTAGWLPPELREVIPLEVPSNLDAASATLRSAGVSLDPRQIDVYQLGALLCQLLTGEPAEAYLRSLRTKMLVPEMLRPVIERALGCDGQARFGTIEDFSAMLNAVSFEFAVEPASVNPIVADSSRAKPDTTPSMVSESSRQTDTSIGPAVAVEERAPADSLPFQKLGHYEIVAKIGQGGMGDVYRGYERSLDRSVAIKVLPAEFARQTDFVRRFRAEATAAAKLVHPNVIQIYFIGETDGYHFFTMQFVEGESLADLLKRQGRLSVDEALPIIEQVFAGLAAAHQHELVHRDIKPGNVLLDRQHHRALLADFGLVKSLQTSSTGKTVTGVIMGTADYMPPEQARGKEIDHRADLYSMGVLMYHMLSGRLPFEADSPTALIFQHVYEQPPPLTQWAPDLPKTLVDVVEKLLRKSPDERYQSAEEVLAELHATRTGNRRREAVHREKRDVVDTVHKPQSSKVKEDLPQLSANLLDIKPLGWWECTRDRAASLFQKHSPEVLKQLQSTQQQVGGAIAEYERRQRKIRRLAREAESVLVDLRTQAVAQRTAAASDRASNHSADELERQVADQEDQLGSIQLDLARVNAKVQQLKSQRDLLNARLRTVQADAKVSGRRIRSSVFQNNSVRAAGTAAVLCLIVIILYFLRTRTSSQDPIEHHFAIVKTPPVAIAPFSAKEANDHSEAWAKYIGLPVEYTNSIGMEFSKSWSDSLDSGSPPLVRAAGL